ncbi:hypothetical protein LNP74_06255 [Klebsiella pneumoniae subsp. pneumoniae]|nr:hypothetical protein [Klebsiella pneumoniae subsp. pneumoniae]
MRHWKSWPRALRQEGDNYYKAHTGANPHRPTRLKDAEEAELLVHNKPDWVDVGVTEKYPGLKQASAEQKESDATGKG